jgi:hypothetical protein
VTLLGGFVLEDVTPDLRLLLIVIFAGALGSWLHAVSSYAAFLGNRSFVTSWVAWYLVRPVIGSGLALIFYFVLRGGLFTANTKADEISLYGFAALAGLCGLFTDRATKKLRELFDAMFPTQVEEKDRLEASPAPALASIESPALAVGATDPALVLTGSGFVPGTTQVLVAGRLRTAAKVQPTRIEVALEPGDVKTAGTLEVEVRNPAPGGGSAETTVEVTESEEAPAQD